MALVAIACIGGLALTISLPGAPSDPSAAAPAARYPGAAQQAFSAGGPSGRLSALDALESGSAEDAGPARTFHNFPDARVQFPFATGVPLSDPFGYRTAPVAQFHDAQDFAAPAGTTVQAIADGRVREAGETSDGCGFGLLLEHRIDGAEVTSRYCHLRDASHTLTVGDTVTVGQPVGLVGATGIAFGAHLHLVIAIAGTAVDPMPFLRTQNRTSRS